MSPTASRIYRVVKETGGPRSANVLSGLAKNQDDFERAIGQLFLAGVVKWVGKKRARKLAPMSR